MSNRIQYEESEFDTTISDLESVISDFINYGNELIISCNTMLLNWRGFTQSNIEQGMKSIQISLLNQISNIEELQDILKNSLEQIKLADSNTTNIIDAVTSGGK